MNRMLTRAILSALLGMVLAGAASAQIGGKHGLNPWTEYQAYFSLVGNYYGYGYDDVVGIREMGILEDELPVLFFIASRSHRHPGDIARYRQGHRSWMDVSRHYGLGPDAYYLSMEGSDVGGFGDRYGYLGYPRERWSSLQFQDNDLVYLANAHMLAGQYRVPPADVYRGALAGKRFYVMEGQYRSGLNPASQPGQPAPKKKKYAFQE